MTEAEIKAAATLAQTAATGLAAFVPGMALAIPFTPLAVGAIIRAYDALMEARPPEVSVAEWRERLLDRALTMDFDADRKTARLAAGVQTSG